jgi:glycosyltransferase involved in cell wall biosynthesis
VSVRILHVLTLVTPENAYGGPVTVAFTQAAAQRSRGHRPVIAAAQRGFAAPAPTVLSGSAVRLFPARTAVPGAGYASLTAPGLHRWLLRHARQADVAHLHLARDLVTLPAAAVVRGLGVPYIVQTHGMVASSDHPLAAPLDRALTRDVLLAAERVLCLSAREVAAVCEVAGRTVRSLIVPNGLPANGRSSDGTAGGKAPEEVLFLARMHERKRPLVFAEAASRLLAAHPDVRFSLVGPDEGQGEAVRRLAAARGAAGRLVWEGPVPPTEVPARLDRCTVYVLPAVDEPFGMSVLEAMARARPVVVTRSCGLAPSIAAHGAGLVVSDDDPAALAAAIDTLLNDPAERARMGERALRLARTEFGISRVVDLLEEAYHEAVAATPTARRP